MKISMLLKILAIFVATVVLAFGSSPVSARRSGGSSKGGGSHGGGTHGGSFHGGGHSLFGGGGHPKFGGGGHFSGNSRSAAPKSFAKSGGVRVNNGRFNGGSYASSGRFTSRPSGNFARSSNFGSGGFGSSAASRNFGRSGGSQHAERSSPGSMGGWRQFGNAGGRSMPTSARASEGAMGGGRQSFGNFSRGRGVEMARGEGSSGRGNGQWHSFGNSGNRSFDPRGSGFSTSRASRGTQSNPDTSRPGFNSNRFSGRVPESGRFSSFSSGPSMTNFGGPRFGNSGLGNSGLGTFGLGLGPVSNSLIGPNLSLIPSLLFGSLLPLGGSALGPAGILGGSVLSFAAHAIVSDIVSNGFGQGGSPGGDFGPGPAGFGGGMGYSEPLPAPACGPVPNPWRPGWTWNGYCGPNPSYSTGWSGNGHVGDPNSQ
jgi:hypothetical protein